MSPDWQRQRNALNHDWLKNEFTRHLCAFVVRAEAPTLDRMRLEEFVTQDWPKWGANQGLLAALLASAESELSPQQLFNQPPLSNCRAKTKMWLSEVVHTLWLTRTPIRSLIWEAQAALADADKKYRELIPLLRAGESLDLDRLRAASGLFKKFEVDVERLSSRISLLPHKVEVV